MKSTNDWLNSLHIIAADEESDATDLSTKEHSGPGNNKKDNSMDALIDLLNKGYDRVRWVGSDECIAGVNNCTSDNICKEMNDKPYIWDLKDFLMIKAHQNIKIISKTARITINRPWEECDQNTRDKILDTPTSALDYATNINFKDIPEEVLNKISENASRSSSFVYRWLKNDIQGEIPAIIVNKSIEDTLGSKYILDTMMDKPHLPNEYRILYDDVFDKNYPEFYPQDANLYNAGDSAIPLGCPIYTHSHVGCNCALWVYKSTDPGDGVFVTTEGLM